MEFTFDNNTIRSLSIKQPWASLIINDYKNIENRKWAVNFDKYPDRRWILVHSSGMFDKNIKGTPEVMKTLNKLEWKKYPKSVILGLMHVSRIEIDCDIEKYKWATGPNCWHIDKVLKFSTPIPAKGSLGLWKPKENIFEKLTKEINKGWVNMSTKSLPKQYCDTLNTLFIDNMSIKDQTAIETIINIVKKSYENKISNKVAFNILYNYYNYPKPTIKSTMPNQWNKSNGFITTTLDIEGVDDFENELLISVNKWFHHNLNVQSTITGEDYPNLKKYDLSNKKTLMNIFESGWRNKNMTSEESKAVRKALDGGGIAQFHPYKGWRLSGFGIWTHIRGSDFVLRKALPVILKKYSKIYTGKLKSSSVPHIIYKPPSLKGGLLKAHNDGGTWNDMYTRCQYCNTLDDWIINYGVQALAHLKGARKGDGGQTFFLGPMDVETFYIILQMVHPATPHPEMPTPDKGWDKAWITASGPKFYQWLDGKTLKIMNRVIKFLKEGSTPVTKSDIEWVNVLQTKEYYDIILNRAIKSKYQIIGKMKMMPKNVNSPYLIVWPNGFIHGSESTGSTPRLTLTIPFGPVGNKEKTDRVLQRLRWIAQGKLDKVLSDKKPYHYGIVHRETKTEVELLPFFKDIYINEKGLDEIQKYFYKYK